MGRAWVLLCPEGMAYRDNLPPTMCTLVCMGLALFVCPARAADPADVSSQLQELKRQNTELMEQLRQQQALINSLSRKVDDIQQRATPTPAANPGSEQYILNTDSTDRMPAVKSPSSVFGKVSISGEGGVGFFSGQSESIYPNPEFAVQEARLFIESPVYEQVYFFGELDLVTPEQTDLQVRLGECYLDFENVSRLWKKDNMLSVRLGRLDIPFGEEYINRYAIDNPLVSRSLPDIWGVDAGLELYGSIGKFSYVMAVQSGGPMGNSDNNGDKSIAGRISYDPAKWLHMSVSGMRTGNLNYPEDYWSGLWFANGWLVPVGGANNSEFHANLAEFDIDFKFSRGHVKAFAGYVHQEENNSSVKNVDMYYYSVEGMYDITKKLYVAARFSEIIAPNGYVLSGQGNMDEYFYSGELTKNLWRLSLGVGYRFSPNLILKAEYAFERGQEVSGESRDQENVFAVQAAFKF